MRKGAFLLFFIVSSFCAQAGVHRCGTLNILISKNDQDTTEKSWNKRKEAMVSVLHDSLDYDLLGLNEVRADQLKYLKDTSILGSIYNFVSNGNNTRNQVLYRKDKYTCLDSGVFYLAPNPAKGTKAWDAEEVRWTVWAKLQDKVSGEIIVYASTHFDTHTIAIREGARVAAEQIKLVAGDYACIITGDLNSEPNEHDSHAYMDMYLGNARQLSKTAPQGPYGTFIPGLKLQTPDAKLLDFLYVRNVDVESYRVFNSPIPGRKLAISDHLPVMCEIAILSPDRDFVHKVNDVAELRKVCQAVQPNDIVVMKEGTYDLGDSALYIANTCVIEGAGSVLKGATQLFSLPNYISLEMRNLNVKEASCSAGVKGSIMYAHGAYLKMANCTIEQCSAAGQGLLYAEDCAVEVEKCVFRNNVNEEEDGGIHITSSVGVDRYPLTMKGCLFENNQSYYASALYFNSDATAYLFGNSFVDNASQEKGAVVIYAPSNAKDLRLVNNTFANNRIDVSSGFMDEGIGGSAIWQEQSDTGCMTLMNNTIVGNYTACMEDDSTSSSIFPSGAVCSYEGKMALFNNVIAGNYSSKEGCGDVAVNDSYNLRGAHNVFSCKGNMELVPGKTDVVAADWASACEQLKLLYEGWQEANGAYHPAMQYYGAQQMPALSPFVTTYAGQSIAVLDMDAMSASLLGSDIMNMGSNTGFLTIDQMGGVRKSPSVPGAMEAGQMEPKGLMNVNVNVNGNGKVFLDGQLLIIRDGKVFNSQGICL